MVMKRSRITDLYRGGTQALPSAATDAAIVAVARNRRESRSPLRFALAAAAMLAAVFILRWYAPGATHDPQVDSTNFGTEEGQAQSWLSTYQPSLTDAGPGSQEGIS